MRRVFFTAACLGLVAGLFHCGSSDVSCVDLGNCTGERDGGGGGGNEGGFDVVAPPGCDLTKSPKESAACVDDAVGVFVSATGDDGATGAKAAPVKSVARGVEIAASKGLPRVYVCEGSYDKAVEVKAPVSVYGGFACAGWAYSGAKPKLAPAKGVAMKVVKVTGAVLVEDFEIVGSADAATPGDSAIGVFVSESQSVTLRGTAVSTGTAVGGNAGTNRSNYSGATATKGENANGAIAGTGPTCACVDATSSKGGNGAAGNGLGLSDGTATPAVGVSNGGLSGTATCNDGQSGANGAAGPAGVPSSAPGTLSAAGWTASTPPSAAPNGKPAQGGGGGGARTNINSAGGGGACGGCGGAGGAAGTDGGSSFALLVFKSNVTIEGGSLISGTAGAGGAGGDGQPGQAGGAAGEGVCNGGAGGNGAGGSGGGGGAGGHSAPIAFVGTEPKVTGATLTPGAKGASGAGGDPGAGPGNPGASGTPGPEGKSQSVLAL